MAKRFPFDSFFVLAVSLLTVGSFLLVFNPFEELKIFALFTILGGGALLGTQFRRYMDSDKPNPLSDKDPYAGLGKKEE